MPSLTEPPATGQRYWRSLDELADTAEFREFLHREFPAGATDILDSADRRQFLRIMGASMALAGLGLSGCRRWPEEHIAPYAHRPAGRSPGVPAHYATCMDRGGSAVGLLVTSFDGRPVKIEGNPLHPTCGNAARLPDDLDDDERARRLHGSSDLIAQASVLDLYDPDRSRGVLHDGRPSDFASFRAWARPRLGTGAGVAVLAGAASSPSVRDMRARLTAALPQATWHTWEPLSHDAEREGTRLAFGRPLRPHYAFDRADIVVSLDADFLVHHPAALRHARDFAATRRADDADRSMSRLYVFESGLSLTGANADERVAMRSAEVGAVAGRLAAGIVGHPGLASFADAAPEAADAIEHALADLRSHGGRSIVVAGPRQPAEVHMLAHLLNQALGNAGTTVQYTPLENEPAAVDSLAALVQRLRAGEVRTLVILGGNPVLTAPADLDFADALGRAEAVVHLGDYVDETSERCTWHVNRAHYLESWGDGRAYDGTVSVCQPLIRPLFDGRSDIELLAALTGDELESGYDIVRRTLAELTGVTDFEKLWRRTLHDGLFPGSAFTATRATVAAGDLAGAIERLRARVVAGGAGLEAVFAVDTSVEDGRYANNGWLQELPDPVTKLTWDNAVLMSPSRAAALDVKSGDHVTVTVGDRVVEAPVLEVPGHAPDSVTLPLGYGRRFAGRIAAGSGVDFYPLRTTGALGFAPATVTKAAGRTDLALTQDHHAIGTMGHVGTQQRLPTIFREGTIEEYREHPQFARHRTHVVHSLSMWEEGFEFQSETGLDTARFAWAKSIDLSACTGCSACVVACQAENNIPIVGKDQVRRGREMHWIRVDRYFRFDDGNDDPDRPDGVALQPVACQHCENAPCEQVCPVAATVHDEDGLNVMVYNRCVGTRYCSNNCPYKVRRFNYFDFHRRDPVRDGGLAHVQNDYWTKTQASPGVLREMQHNPEVTVRVRGVMEKCTYCIQRISAARIEAKNEWVALPEDQKRATDRVSIPDGTIVPACAQACPAEAIVFGDLLDPESRVSRLHRADRAYSLLEELNPKPRTRYLARLRNPAGGGTGGHHPPGAEGAPASETVDHG